MSDFYESSSIERETPPPLIVEDWLHPRNTRAIIHIGRDLLLKEVRSSLTNLEPLLAAQRGLCFFRTYADDAEHKVLVTNHEKFAGENSVVIASNKTRSALPTEPNFPGGQTLEMLDIAVPSQSRWLSARLETIYRSHHDRQWATPTFATLIEPNHDSVRLVGNIRNNTFAPHPAEDLSEVASDADILWAALSSLALCTSVSLEEHVINFRD